MPVRPVLRLPEPVLKRVAEPVKEIDEEALALAQDLLDTMRASPACVGLAAPQIGVGLRAFSVNVTGHKKAESCHGEFVLFNPEVLLAHGPLVAREGCMSVPDLTGDVARAGRLVVRGLTPEGAERVLQVDAFEARAVQHEIDHLDGLLFLDRVTSADAVFKRRVYR
ncbi:MAG TPA: peptide deformylase [Acidimicrobiales bacterium]|jgi:peptide deformylase|nr:peptide deformylase [Acidimicrobiales bacterium]